MPTNQIQLVLTSTAAGAGIRTTVSGLQSVQQQAQGLTAWLQKTAASMFGVISASVGLYAVANKLKEAVEVGVKFNAVLEDAKLGVAAVLKQFNPQGYKTMADAIVTAADAIELLKKKAVEAPGSFQELVTSFQSVAGAATSAKISLRDQVDLVVLMSQTIAGLGIRPEQLIQESRALITGNINQHALAAKIMGITRAQVMQARESGTLFEFLSERLSSFGEAGKLAMQNFSVALSNLGDVAQQKLAELMLPTFQRLKAFFLELTDLMKDTNIKRQLGDMSELFALIVGGVANMATFAVRNIGLISDAVEALTLAFTLLAAKASVSLALTGAAKVADLVVWMGAMSGVIAQVSRASGLIAGVVAAMSTVSTATAVIGSLFTGWKIGEWLGELQFLKDSLGGLGVTLNDVVTFNILKAMKAWEQFKVSLGFGSAEAVKAIDDSIKQLLVPGSGTASQKKVPDMGDTAEQLQAKYEKRTKELDLEVRTNQVMVDRLRLRGELTRAEGKDGPGAMGAGSGFMTATFRRIGSMNQEYEAIKKLLRARLELIEARDVETMKAEMAGAIDRDTAMQDNLKTQQEMLALQKELLDLQEQTNDYGFWEKLGRDLQDIEDQFDHLGAAVADVLSNGISSAIDTVSNGLWRVIDGTATWGDLMRQVGRQIISDLIRIALQEIFLQNLKKGLLIAWKAILSAFRTADVVEHNATEASKTPALATNATLASIESWGIAVAIGVAAIAAILASMGAFESGGVVKGGQQLIRVNESGTEAVLNSRAVAMLGEARINALNAGVGASLSSPGVSGGRGDGGSGRQTLHVLVVDDRAGTAAREFIESSAGQVAIVDTARRQKAEIGIR